MSHEADQLEGFKDLLDATGQALWHGPNEFRGLIKRLRPQTEEYDLTPTDDDAVLVSVLRAEIPTEALKVGGSITDAEGTFYRVTRLHRSPRSLVARIECTVLNP